MSFSFSIKPICDFLMIFAPSTGYIIQGLTFKQTSSSEGFSLYMCLILLFANILRIFFWFGKQFTVVLLFQSCIVILSQFYLIHMFLKYSKQPKSHLSINKSIFNLDSLFNKEIFWKWDKEIEYYKCIILCLMMFMLFCKAVNGMNNIVFVEIIGAISAFSESIIAIPQIKENCIKKNCDNISLFMVGSWFVGDSFKIGYYIYTLSPLQLISCGIFQVCLDIILTTQVLYYQGYLKITQTKPKNDDQDEIATLIKTDIKHIKHDDIEINKTSIT